jgi:hypothetical protein
VPRTINVTSFVANLRPTVRLPWCPWSPWINVLPWTPVRTVSGYGCGLRPIRLSKSVRCSCQDVRLLSRLHSKSPSQCALVPGALEVEQPFPGCPSVYSTFSSSLTVTHGRILNFDVLAYFARRCTVAACFLVQYTVLRCNQFNYTQLKVVKIKTNKG